MSASDGGGDYRITWSASGWVVERISDGARIGIRNRAGRTVLTHTSSDTKVVHGNREMALALALALNRSTDPF